MPKVKFIELIHSRCTTAIFDMNNVGTTLISKWPKGDDVKGNSIVSRFQFVCWHGY